MERLNLWAPRVLSLLRIIAALLFMEHGLMKLFHFPVAQPGAPDPLPVRLSPADETAEEWTAAVHALPRCIHVFVGSRCFACHAPADGGRFSNGVREWPVCKSHAASYGAKAIERGAVAR